MKPATKPLLIRDRDRINHTRVMLTEAGINTFTKPSEIGAVNPIIWTDPEDEDSCERMLKDQGIQFVWLDENPDRNEHTDELGPPKQP